MDPLSGAHSSVEQYNSADGIIREWFLADFGRQCRQDMLPARAQDCIRHMSRQLRQYEGLQLRQYMLSCWTAQTIPGFLRDFQGTFLLLGDIPDGPGPSARAGENNAVSAALAWSRHDQAKPAQTWSRSAQMWSSFLGWGRLMRRWCLNEALGRCTINGFGSAGWCRSSGATSWRAEAPGRLLSWSPIGGVGSMQWSTTHSRRCCGPTSALLDATWWGSLSRAWTGLPAPWPLLRIAVISGRRGDGGGFSPCQAHPCAAGLLVAGP